MKKLFTIIALAIVASTAFISCENDKKTEEPIILDTPAFAEYAAKYEFPEPVIINNELVKSIEYTESGYVITTILVPVTKADVEYIEKVFIEKYTVSETGALVSQNLGEVVIENSTLTVNEETFEVTVAETAPVNDETKDLCRTWVVKSTDLTLDSGIIGAAGVNKLFENGNIDDMVAWAIDKGMELNQCDGYNVVDITFTKAGTFLVNFEEAEPFCGSWSLDGETFKYDTPNFRDIFTEAESEGTIIAKPNGYVLSANVSAKRNDKLYSAKVEITIIPAAEV